MGEFDITLQPSDLNGLKMTSLLRLNKFATIDKDLIIGCLGSLDGQSVKLLNTNLTRIFKLKE